MQHHLICRVKLFEEGKNERLEFTWSCGRASFEAIVLDRYKVEEFREGSKSARELLNRLVSLHVPAEADRNAVNIRSTGKQLADAGFGLYSLMLPPSGPSADARKWFEGLSRTNSVAGIEVVCDGAPWFAPWNTVYGDDPDSRFDTATDLAAFEPFWGIRYNLASGLPVNPLRNHPLPASPDILLVIDPKVENSLKRYIGKSNVSEFDRLQEYIQAAKASGANVRKVDLEVDPGRPQEGPQEEPARRDVLALPRQPHDAPAQRGTDHADGAEQPLAHEPDGREDGQRPRDLERLSNRQVRRGRDGLVPPVVP